MSGTEQRVELERLRAENARLRQALEWCDVAMDTLAVLGQPRGLPEAYRDSWARAHDSARRVLDGTARGGIDSQ